MQLLKKRPGLIVLILLLFIISIGCIKPAFYLFGWDNFSSYLNPVNNIWMTFFSAWREHRGLGVASDAEITDIPRQLFCFFISFIVGKNMSDQFYMVAMLWGGVLSMYFLGRYVSHLLNQKPASQELFGFLAGFFYLFNLSTLAVFYFPMIMYNTRFFLLPCAVYILLRLIKQPHISKRTYVLYCFFLFIGIGSFMVPTIFVVFDIFLALMGVFLPKTKRLFAVLVFFILINMFWLLPFANYTIQKSKIVPLAPTFVEINESMLNKPASYYSFERQAKLRPSFFSSQFSNNTTGKLQYFHELSGIDEIGWRRVCIWIFPALYLLGIGYILFFRRNRIMMWFASGAFVFLMLSMKEYSPFGYLYSLISDHVPFANTIFRFGDTKFHAMIAFSGSIVAAYFLVELLGRFGKLGVFGKWGVNTIIGIIIISHIILFKSYFNGNFIGFFMYNKLPSAYTDIAKIINSDPDPIRVIQLPFDTHSYWKPYSWGYFGSSFLHFMLNKPLFDRSFEPASLENSDIHKQIMDTVDLVTSVPDESLLKERALDLLESLRSLSVKYIIDDQTISTNIDARNIQYWGTINPTGSHRLLTYLETKGYITSVQKYSIDSYPMAKDYETLYPYTKQPKDRIYQPKNITLYLINEPTKRIQFIQKTDIVNSNQNLLTSARVKRLAGSYVQDSKYDTQATMYPFIKTTNQQINVGKKISLSLPVTVKGTYVFENNDIPSNQTRLFSVYAQSKKKEITLSFEQQIFPSLNNASLQSSSPITSVAIPTSSSDYQFIQIENEFFPIENSSSLTYVGSLILHSDTVSLSLLSLQENKKISDTSCSNTHCPSLQIPFASNSKNISFAKLSFDISGTSTPESENEKIVDSRKNKLKKEIEKLSDPLILNVCIKTAESDICLNKETYSQVNAEENHIIIPLPGSFEGIDSLTALLSLEKNQKFTLSLKNILFQTFSPSGKQTISLPESTSYTNTYTFNNPTSLTLSTDLSDGYYSKKITPNSAGLLRYDDSCSDPGKYRAIKKTTDGFLSFVVGCRNFIQKNIPFSGNNFYLWSVDYKHMSGAFPSLILMDKLNTYTNTKLLPDSIDPNNYFSLSLQNPEQLLAPYHSLSSSLTTTSLYSTKGYITPQPDLQDTKNKEFIIQHHSENEGLVEIQNMSLSELPNYWYTSKLKPQQYQTLSFDTPEQTTYKRIIPSLWIVHVDSSKSAKTLLQFNEAYDKQWIIIGTNTIAHLKCNGFANCYEVSLQKGVSQFYIVYFPEFLAVIGWIVTLIGIFWGIRSLRVNS